MDVSSCSSIIQNNKVLRIVMVGKTGIGKSSAGNTILGPGSFESKFSAKSVTVECSKRSGVVDGKEVAIVDTPGLFDTRFSHDETAKYISRCITYSSPGPHIFLVVIKLGRFTEEEKQTVQMIQQIFGEAADKYSMVLFTHGDHIAREDTTIEEFLQDNPELQDVVDRCNGQYHVFNNKAKDRTQVTQLINKIDSIVQRNGGSHYTSTMFQEAERAIEEKKQQILREKKEQIRREREEVQRELQEEYEKKLQAEREREREVREKEKEEWSKERQRENAEREEERKREMQQREEQMKAEHDRALREAEERLQERYERQARAEAEKSSFLSFIVDLVRVVGECLVKVFKK
ncbi:GTPase IMAP family member 9-like [Genypterus blacodes]|uniref:GTPase IMAP family member 9-like n=1 Tax=Genypterus blacodes TaxID=154954 RepID=UPI003F76D543